MIQISLERMLTGYKVIIEGGYYFSKSNLTQMTKLMGEFSEEFFKNTGERPVIKVNPRKKIKTFLKLEPYVEDLAAKILEHIANDHIDVDNASEGRSAQQHVYQQALSTIKKAINDYYVDITNSNNPMATKKKKKVVAKKRKAVKKKK